MSELPRVSVIVPHFNDLAGLARCLAALMVQTYPNDQVELIVADNGSPQGEAVVANVVAGRARLVVVQEKGAGPARNGGVAASSGEILAFIDSDCQAEPAWLAEGVAALKRFDFVGGHVRVLVEDAEHMTGAEAFERVFAFDFESYINRKGFAGAGNLFCPRELFGRVGGFRVGVSEDVEWSHRARRAGYQIGYASRAVVGHPARRTWSELQRKWSRMNAETFGLYAERRGGRWLWVARSLALPASAIAHSPKVLVSKKLDTAAQKVSALAMLFRLRLWRMADGLRLLTQSRSR